MKNCPHCGREWEDEARFCTHCMTPLNGKTAIAPIRVFRKRNLHALVALLLCAALVAGTIPLLGHLPPVVSESDGSPSLTESTHVGSGDLATPPVGEGSPTPLQTPTVLPPVQEEQEPETETGYHAVRLSEVPEGYTGIYTKSDLDGVRKNLDGNYLLMNDIVFSPSDFDTDGDFYNDGRSWLPIGEDEQNPFTGTFDGNGYAIRNLRIRSADAQYVGLFGYVKNGAVRNLNLVDSDISSYFSQKSVYRYDDARKEFGFLSTAEDGTLTEPLFIGGGVWTFEWIDPSTNWGYPFDAYVGNRLENSLLSLWDAYIESFASAYELLPTSYASVAQDGRFLTPGKEVNVAFTFRAPHSGTVDYQASIYSTSAENRSYSANGGTCVYLYVNETRVWPETEEQAVFYSNTASKTAPKQISATSIHLQEGDLLRLVLAPKQGTTYSGKTCYLADYPVVSYQSDEEDEAAVFAGGIAGCMEESTMENCSVSGEATLFALQTSSCLGGLVGYQKGENSLIRNCYSKNVLLATAKTTDSQSTVTVTGGIAGCMEGAIEDSYNNSDLKGNSIEGMYLGGIAGVARQKASLSNVYSIASLQTQLSYTEEQLCKDYVRGGLVGHATQIETENCYYSSLQKEGVGNIPGHGWMCHEERMQLSSSFAGFDFESVWSIGEDPEYLYPKLRSFDMSN